MTFANPMAALIGAAATLPVLLLLYFLKLRRRSVEVPAVFLWRRAVRDLQANTPFQRLHWSWLLAIQLLALLLILTAMARPMLGGPAGEVDRVILVIDVSASMAARHGHGSDQSRFDAAKETALAFVDRLGERGRSSQAMVIAFGARAWIAATFTSDQAALRVAVEGLEVADEPGLLAPALRLAEANLSPGAAEGATTSGGDDAASAASRTRIVLLSDGRMGDNEPPSLSGAKLDYVMAFADQPDTGADNIGIVLLSARREYADPSNVSLLCGLSNTSPQARHVAVRLEIDGEWRDVQTIEVPGATAASNAAVAATPDADSDAPTPATVESPDPLPGEAAVIFRFSNTGGGLVRVSHSYQDDDLRADDSAAILLAPARPAMVLVVSPTGQCDPFLDAVLELLNLAGRESMSVANFQSLAAKPVEERLAALDRFALIIFDRVSPTFVPPRPTLSLGAAPPLPDVRRFDLPDETPGRRALSWDRRHPVMSNVGLDSLAVADRARLDLPDSAALLALGAGGPLIGLVRAVDGRSHLIVSFQLAQSNWPIQASFAVFIQNAVEYLTLSAPEEAGFMLHGGEPATLRAATGAASVRLSGPAAPITLPIAEDGTVAIPALRRVGVYRAEGLAAPLDRLPVNLLSAVESNTRPVRSLSIGSTATKAGTAQEALPREAWPWFVMAAVGLLFIEWWVYTSRARE